MSRHRKKPRLRKLRSMYIWHRYIGVSAALLVILLAITGVLLNHTEALQLDSRYVRNGWLLDHYGIHAPARVRSFAVQERWLSQWGERLYLDDTEVGRSDRPLLGALAHEGMLVAALEGEIWLLTPEGELIEKLGGGEGVPAGMRAIGHTPAGKLAVQAAHGIYVADAQLLDWRETPGAQADWIQEQTLPEQRYQRLLEHYRGRGLNLERVILDLHSGRLFGRYGIYVMDAAALLMLFLALSGTWIWGMRHIRNRQRKPGRQHK